MKKFLTSVLSTIAVSLIAFLIYNGGDALITNLFAPGKINKLAGTYYCQEHVEAETAEKILVNNDFYEEEIALADLNSLYRPRYIEFDTDKNYSFYVDANGYRSNVMAFLRQTYDRMYDNRSQLAGLYDVDLVSMSRDEFLNFYAGLYGQTSFDAMIELLSSVYDYTEMGSVERGTYTVKGSDILTKVGGLGKEESIGYRISGDTLTLTFSDVVLTFNKIK